MKKFKFLTTLILTLTLLSTTVYGNQMTQSDSMVVCDNS